MLDIDNFKSYNDRYGHVQGDLALKAVTATVEKATRAEDFVARYGGEEFIVILPNATSARARKIAERIRQKVARIRVKASRKNLPRGFEKITISLGIAQLPKDGQRAIRAMLTRADQALYEAKKRGKNQVCIK